MHAGRLEHTSQCMDHYFAQVKLCNEAWLIVVQVAQLEQQVLAVQAELQQSSQDLQKVQREHDLTQQALQAANEVLASAQTELEASNQQKVGTLTVNAREPAMAASKQREDNQCGR